MFPKTTSILTAGLMLAGVVAPAGAQSSPEEDTLRFTKQAHVARAPLHQTSVDARIRSTWIDPEERVLGRALVFEGRRDGGWGSVLMTHFLDARPAVMETTHHLVGERDRLLDLETRAVLRAVTTGGDVMLFTMLTPDGIGAFLAVDGVAVTSLLDLGVLGASIADLRLTVFENEVVAEARARTLCLGEPCPPGSWLVVGAAALTQPGSSPVPFGGDDDSAEELEILSHLEEGQVAVALGAVGLARGEARVAMTGLFPHAPLALQAAHDAFRQRTEVLYDQLVENRDAVANAPTFDLAAEAMAITREALDQQIAETELLLQQFGSSTVASFTGMGPANAPPGPLGPSVRLKDAVRNMKSVRSKLRVALKLADKGHAKFIKKYVAVLHAAIEKLKAIGYNLRGFRANRIAHLPLPSLVKPEVKAVKGGGGNGGNGKAPEGDLQGTMQTGFLQPVAFSTNQATANYDPQTGILTIRGKQKDLGTLEIELVYDPASGETRSADAFDPDDPTSLVRDVIWKSFVVEDPQFSEHWHHPEADGFLSLQVSVPEPGKVAVTVSAFLFGFNGLLHNVQNVTGVIPYSVG